MTRPTKRTIAIAAVAVVVLAMVLVARALRAGGARAVVEPAAPIAVDRAAALDRLSTAITFPTISRQDGSADGGAFGALHAHLAAAFPLVHARLARDVVNGAGLLYTWTGRDAALPPLVLMGHLDVVPVVPGTEDAWEQPPFSGARAGGFVWGRGTLDDKAAVVAILEAVEYLLQQGFEPRRTVHLAFGHDEEVGGVAGGQAILERLRSRGLREAACVLDEGGAITRGLVPGVPGPAALVGIAEKGILNLRLEARGTGGHSSAPPPQTSIGIIAAAIARLEATPFPSRIDGATRAMLDALAPSMPFGRRLVSANLWLFGPLVKHRLASRPSSAAAIRTTTAATVVQGGVQANVLPIDAWAVLNFRILPGDTVRSVTDHVTAIVADPRVRIMPASGIGIDPSPVSDARSPWFGAIDRSIRSVTSQDDLAVAPYLVMGATDARHWTGVSRHVYRFTPFEAPPDVLERAHGTNERLSIDSYLTGIRFYVQFLRASDTI